MPRCNWRGEWYIYNHAIKEFLRGITDAGRRKPNTPDGLYVRWTPGILHAKAYKNPSMAERTARRLNAALGGGTKCRVVTVVTGEAARCLDEINRREANEETEIHGV